MDIEPAELQELRIDDLVPFGGHSPQTDQGGEFHFHISGDSDEKQIPPIIVRPVPNGKFEVISSYNRIVAMKRLGCVAILADVRAEMSDSEATELFGESTLSKEYFSDCSFAQKIEMIRYAETWIKNNSRQGQRNDLAEGENEVHQSRASQEIGQKSDRSYRKPASRDQVAKRLGIPTSTLSDYRQIAKLSDDLIRIIARLLDGKKIPLKAAYYMSYLDSWELETLAECIEKLPDKKIDMVKLKELAAGKKRPGKIFLPFSRERIEMLLVSR